MSDRTLNKSEKIILASASPRRCELLKLITDGFDVISADVDETLESGISAEDAVLYLSRKKAEAVSENNRGRIVVGADTVVVFGEKILGKPQNEEEAFSMLSMLSGETHRVLTGVTLTDGKITHSFYSESAVTFWNLNDKEILSYITSGEGSYEADTLTGGKEKLRHYWEDKAGGYGIQEPFGMKYIKSISGDYYNIVGLPVSSLCRALKDKFNIEL